MADKRDRWRGGETATARTAAAPGRRRRTILIVVGIMLAIGGGLAALFVYLAPYPEPQFLDLSVVEQADRVLPVDAFAAQDADALFPLFPEKYRLRATNSHGCITCSA